MSVRSSNPGEKSIHAYTGQSVMVNRTVRAQIKKVDNKNGLVDIDILDTPSSRTATVSPLWMSFPNPNKSGPSWGRFMPQETEVVKVSFDTDHKCHIIGCDIIAGREDVADGQTGWPKLNDAHELAKKGDSKYRQFTQFRPLNQGEYDFMSSGGAYIHGNDKGRLFLTGGPVTISLIKNDLKLETESQLVHHKVEHSNLRLGQIRRSGANGTESKVSDEDDLKEFNLSVVREVGTGYTPITEMIAGDCYDSSGNSMLSGVDEADPVDIRFIYTVYDSMGEEAYKQYADKSGNFLSVSQGITKISANRYAVIDSEDIRFGPYDEATESLVLGDTYANAETQYVNDLKTEIENLRSQVSTLNTALTTFSQTLAALPPNTLMVGAPIASAAAPLNVVCQAVSPQLSVISTNLTNVAQTFVGSYTNDYLSKVSKTK